MLASTKRLKSFGNLAYMFSVALVIASLLTSLVPPRTASAHHPELSGTAVCQQDGTYLVTWTINNWSGTTLPMTITAINLSIGVPTGTVVPTSVQGTHTFPGKAVADITLTVSGSWSNGATGTTTSGKVKLKGDCKPPPPPDYQLNLSHIECVNGQVEIHFVLLNVPDGITPGTLTYTYGTIVPGNHTGNVWHYTDYKPDGNFDIQSASVIVNGVTVTLHNPGAYAGSYQCAPQAATASVSVGQCTWTAQAGSLTAVTLTLSHASLTINGATYTTSQTINLPPGTYPYTWTALAGYVGSGSGSAVVGNCTPGNATASVSTGQCTWTAQAGSLTAVTLTLTGASFTINGVTYTTSQTINLPPGTYPYTWIALAGYQGSGSGSVVIGDCTPPDATASVSVGQCTWTEAGGSLTAVTLTLTGASLTINGVTYTTSQTINLPPGTYPYTWTALAGYKGSGSGSTVVGDCTPPDASASVSVGQCTWDEEDGSLTAVTLTLTGASLTINGVTYTTSQTINLPPGTYPYTWTAKSGFKGSGSGSVVIGDCTPGNATASVSTGQCTWDERAGSMTSVTLTLDHASFTINGVTYTTSQAINLPPGTYPYSWTALSGYKGSGSGTLVIGECVPLPVPTGTLVCYTLEFAAFKLNVGNSGPSGLIGYSTNLDATIISLGIISSGGSTPLLIPGGATTLYLYPSNGQGGWGTPVEVALDNATTRVCEEDPMGLVSFCSYLDLEQPVGWTVTNLNPFAVAFTWVYGSESSSGPIALAPGAEISFATSDQSGEVMQIFVDGVLIVSGEHEICPEFISLTLTGICSNDPASTHGWSATNPNAFAVEAEWRVNGSLLTGLLNIPANSSAQFTTPVFEGSIVQLYYGGVEQDNAGAAKDCLPPENPPETPPETPPLVPPVTGGQTPVLIPVTGVADDLSGLATSGMLNFGLGFFGLGVVLHGLARRQIKQQA